MSKKKRKSNFQLIKYLMIIVIAVSVLGGLYGAGKSQFLASKAINPLTTGDVNLNINDLDNGITKVEVLFKTGKSETETELISSIAFRLNLSSKSNSKLTLVDKDGNNTDKLSTENSLDGNDWIYPVNKSQEIDSGLIVDFSVLNKSKSGYSNFVAENLATFYVKGVTGGSDLNYTFDKDLSVMFSKRRPVSNIWQF